MIKPLFVIALIASAACGYAFSARQYKLNGPWAAADQRVLSHRDSAYTAISWVATPGENTLQLRFFDRVEGGVCLRPTWAEICELAKGEPRLSHLVPTARPTVAPAEATWPQHWPLPDPGTVNSSPYISLFPAGLLLNKRLMDAAGGDLHKAKPKVLIVGLGSGVGSAQIFHHCPNADITVVDIDHAVIEMVRDHYPLLKYMEESRKQLHLITADARSYIRYDAPKGAFDMVVLDAYTAGSTIPPHLMTREFFAKCGELIHDDGVVFANVIGSYASESEGALVGQQHKVLGGAIRSMRAARRDDAAKTPLLPYTWVFPIFQSGRAPSQFRSDKERKASRNNIVIAGRQPLDPKKNPSGWQRLREHEPLKELPAGRWVTTTYVIGHDENGQSLYSSKVPERFVAATIAALAGSFKVQEPNDAPNYSSVAVSSDAALIAALRSSVLAAAGSDGLSTKPYGWNDPATYALRITDDWVRLPREVWRVAVAFSQSTDENDGESLTGPIDGSPERNESKPTWSMRDAPLFTDQSPNADIWNR